jgi:hypothetical protein
MAVVALAVAIVIGGDDNVDIPTTRLDPRAEQLEREAHLEGQAKTHGGRNDSANNNQSESSDRHDDEFVPGSRHMPMR